MKLLFVLLMIVSSIAMAENCAVIDMLSTDNGPFAYLDMSPINLSGKHATAKTGMFQVVLDIDKDTHIVTSNFTAINGEVVAGLPMLALAEDLRGFNGFESAPVAISKPAAAGTPQHYFTAKAVIRCE